MNQYTEAVQQILDDYLDRLRLGLAALPPAEREEFVREIASHIYEAYQLEPVGSEVARILAVLRKLGEPSEVVAGRLSEAVVRSGRARRAPLYVLGGILLAMFGAPLGVGGMAFLGGVLATLACAVAAYYLFTGAILFSGALLGALAMIRLVLPDIWVKLHAAGVIQVGDWFDQLRQTDQVIMLGGCAALLVISGIWLLRGGRHMVRGIRFLMRLATDWLLGAAARLRRLFGHERTAPGNWSAATWAGQPADMGKRFAWFPTRPSNP
jgi:uncharacterized membrane protein